MPIRAATPASFLLNSAYTAASSVPGPPHAPAASTIEPQVVLDQSIAQELKAALERNQINARQEPISVGVAGQEPARPAAPVATRTAEEFPPPAAAKTPSQTAPTQARVIEGADELARQLVEELGPEMAGAKVRQAISRTEPVQGTAPAGTAPAMVPAESAAITQPAAPAATTTPGAEPFRAIRTQPTPGREVPQAPQQGTGVAPPPPNRPGALSQPALTGARAAAARRRLEKMQERSREDQARVESVGPDVIDFIQGEVGPVLSNPRPGWKVMRYLRLLEGRERRGKLSSAEKNRLADMRARIRSNLGDLAEEFLNDELPFGQALRQAPHLFEKPDPNSYSSRPKVDQEIDALRTQGILNDIDASEFYGRILRAHEGRKTWADRQRADTSRLDKMAAAAEAEATKNQWNVVIAVVDDGGHLLYLQRMDGVQTGSIDVAISPQQITIGSLLALVSYPLFFETQLTRRAQAGPQ